MRRITVFGVLTAVLAVAAIAPSGALANTSASRGEQAFAHMTGQAHGRVHVAVRITKFVATASGTKAQGIATATLRSLGATPTTVKRKVTLAVAKKGTCSILSLTLNQLNLTLLGLNVHLDKVVLNVTGKRNGGVLGSLFCSLAGAKAKAARAAAARKLTVHVTRQPMQPLAVTVGIRAQTAQATPTCSVLDLVLGPLHLNLLGLVVDLNRVHLSITATPNGGILGNLFCGLANGTTPTA